MATVNAIGTPLITLGGSLTLSGAYTFTGILTGDTTLTFPTSGTLVTSTSAVTSIAGTTNQLTASSPTGSVTLAIAANAVLPGTAGLTVPQGNTAARAGSAGTIRFNTQTNVFEVTLDGAAWVTLDTHSGGDVDSIIGTADQVIASNPTGNVTLSLPQSIATTSAVQFNTVRLNTSNILDSNGNVASNFPATASAVNYLSFQNSATSGALVIQATGSDSNIALNINSKGTSGVNIKGRTDLSTVGAGFIGQKIESNVPNASAVSVPGTSPKSLTSISLTAGIWLVTGNIFFNANASTMNETIVGISLVNNTLPDASYTAISAPNGTDNAGATAPSFYMNINSTTTVYIVGTHGSASVDPTMSGNLAAYRIG
jgi:hypothetical protein